MTSVACPGLAPAIQDGDPFDEPVVAMVREYAAPLRAAGVDTVILGCTHYPVVERMLRRALPGVVLIKSGEEIAREVGETLPARGSCGRLASRAATGSCAAGTRRRSGAPGRASCRCRSGGWPAWTRRPSARRSPAGAVPVERGSSR